MILEQWRKDMPKVRHGKQGERKVLQVLQGSTDGGGIEGT
jgi:hypothetical protein